MCEGTFKLIIKKYLLFSNIPLRKCKPNSVFPHLAGFLDLFLLAPALILLLVLGLSLRSCSLVVAQLEWDRAT